MRFHYDRQMNTSMFISGTQINSIAQFGENSLILSSHMDKVILVVVDWKIVKEHRPDEVTSFSQSQLLPNFDWEQFPFILVIGKRSLKLVNVKTGQRDELVLGSANNDSRQKALWFTDLGNDRISLNFCTETRTYEQTFEHNWYNIQFNSDFAYILRTYGRLPITKIDKSM